ncbi:MAG: hypothetical protein ACTHK7_01910 [Aureliella sp.]
MTKRIDLKTKPRMLRTGRAKSDSKPAVDMTGGMFGAGIIRDVSVITTGEALGHELWIDQEFLQQTASAIQAAGDRGVKSRFTHPGMSSDGLGRHLGRINNARVEGNQVKGDLHFATSAHSTPDGDLAEYVASLVSEDATAAGLSIVFMRDRNAESQFMLANGAKFDGRYLDASGYKSPDPANTDNYPHARLGELRAADLVDEPAANPDGMFDSMPIAREADKALAYALGLTSEKPSAEMFGVNSERAAAFVTRFLSTRGLEVTTKQSAETTTDPKPEGKTREQFSAELKKFTDRFGAENGVKWFNEDKSYSDALELHCDALGQQVKDGQKKIEELEAKFKSLELGETRHVETGSTKDAGEAPKKTLGAMLVPSAN